MAELLRVGPALIFLGNPITAAGADMTYIGKTRGDITIAPQVQMAFARTDQTGIARLASNVHFTGIDPLITVPLVDEDKDKLVEYYHNSSKIEAGGHTAIGFGSGYKKIAEADIPTMCILPLKPVADYTGTNGIDEPTAFWVPAAVNIAHGGFVFNLPENEDSLNPREEQFAGCMRLTDQDSTDIPAAGRQLFQGSPTALGLTWTLPDLSDIVP